MDQRTLLTTLSREQRRELTRKSDVPGALHLLAYLAAMALFASLVAMRVPYWPLAMIPLGILIVFLFCLLHETSHKSVFKTSWLNALVARLCGLLIFLPAEWFRWFHFQHHRYTQIRGKDPELDTPKPDTLGKLLLHVTGGPVWLAHIRTLFGNAGGVASDFVPAAKRGQVRLESRVLLLIYFLLILISVYYGSLLMLYVWVFPALLGQPFLRLYLLAEHAGCAYSKNVLENTRTVRTHSLIRFLAWNMPYHVEHHAFPTVPFHKLPALHQVMQPHLQVTAQGYTGFLGDYVGALTTGRARG